MMSFEDTSVTFEALRDAGYPEAVIEAVDALTRRGKLDEGERYFDYIRRCRENPIARAIKVADITDNLRPGPVRDSRYERALEILTEESDCE